MPILTRLSIFLSSLCLAHCLAMPLVVLLLPALAHFFSETVEILLVMSILPVSLIAFLPVWNRHRNNSILRVFIISLILIFGSQFVFHGDLFLNSDSANLMAGSFSIAFIRGMSMLAGSLGLAYSLYMVNRHTHVCTNPHHHHH
ncbi:MAG: MerC domain-containing protein [Balneolaceae bacterium]|nr:MAG: MerC domain-containing protein [Balneolaceae bacterium]